MEEHRCPRKWFRRSKLLVTVYPVDRRCWVVVFRSVFSLHVSSCFRILLAKVFGRALMLACTPSQGGLSVHGLLLNAPLGLCPNNSFIYTLKLNYTSSILLHIMQLSFTKIEHRCSEITLLFSQPHIVSFVF